MRFMWPKKAFKSFIKRFYIKDGYFKYVLGKSYFKHK